MEILALPTGLARNATMKVRCLVVLMPCFVVGACKKPAPNPSTDPSHMAIAEVANAKVSADKPVSPESVSDGENQRARPRPRPPKPEKPPVPEYPAASQVPGKEGFVFSPYNNQIIDVRDIPSGTLAADPTFPSDERKYFRVP